MPPGGFWVDSSDGVWLQANRMIKARKIINGLRIIIFPSLEYLNTKSDEPIKLYGERVGHLL